MYLCGVNDDGTVDLSRQVYYTIYTIIVTILFAYLGTNLLKNLQMFPIKEKSGRLILVFFIFNYNFLVSYPILLFLNLDPDGKSTQPISGALRFHYNVYVITYFMRACRLSYAFNTKFKMQGFLYQIMKNENICCFLTIIIGFILYSLPGNLLNYKENIYVDEQDNPHLYFNNRRILKIIVVAINQGILLVSLFMIRKVQSNFKIKTELALAFLLEVIIISIKNVLVLTKGEKTCYNQFPLPYSIDCCKIFILVWITVVSPLLQINKDQEYFPYAIIADNFELFLSEPLCINLFNNFLCDYDQKYHRIQQQNFFKPILQNTPIFNPIKENINDQYPQSVSPSQQSYDSTLKIFSYDERIKKQSKSPRFPETEKYNEYEIGFIQTQDQIELTDQKLQTVECYMLWMDLTLIFAKHNALNQNQPPDDPKLLYHDILNYTQNLIQSGNLKTMMPHQLADELEMLKQFLLQSDKLIQIVKYEIINCYDSAYLSRLSRGSKVEDDIEIKIESDDLTQQVGVLKLAYEIRFLMFQIISKIFKDNFQRTTSFKTIQNQFRDNEEIQFRLYSLNLTKEFK